MNLPTSRKYEAIVMGTSAGGMEALKIILRKFPPSIPVPVIIVQHRSKDEKELLEKLLQSYCSLRIKQADEKETILSGTAYIAPPNYHLLVEKDHTFSLSTEALRNYSRPSIDILFETASETFRERLIGVILTGANSDGAAGLQKVKLNGGLSIVQNPITAQFSAMPAAAIERAHPQHILSLEDIPEFLLQTIGYPTGKDA